MEELTVVNGKITYLKAKEYNKLQMAENMTGNLREESNMGMGCIHGETVNSMKEIGKTESNMVKAHSQLQQTSLEKEFGLME